MNKIQEVSGCQWHWLMRFWGAPPSDGSNAEKRAGYSNTGYGIVKVDGGVIGLVTRYNYDNPRYFVGSSDLASASVLESFGAPTTTREALFV